MQGIEKAKRQNEELIRKNKKNRNKTTEMQSRDLNMKGKEYSMDVSGSLVPVSRIPVGKLRTTEPKAKAKISSESVINYSTNNVDPLNDRRNEISAILPVVDPKELYKSFQPEINDDMGENVDYHVADLSSIEPSFGVVLRVGHDNEKRGPSFMENPKYANKTMYGFNPRSLKQDNTREPKRAVSSYTYARPRANGERKGNMQMKVRVDESPDEHRETGDILLVSHMPEYHSVSKTDISKYKGTVVNKTFYTNQGKSPIGKVPSKSRVIVASESLRKNLEYVEGNAVTRPRTTAQKYNFVHKKSIVMLLFSSEP
jgi:hypothetical protein